MERTVPLISVYITNYNYGRYIRQSIESLLHQTLQDFELFIIDDGSTDESRKVIEEYAQLDNVSIIYQKNKGLNITNNIALRVSRGKYIMRLDADDYLEPNALEKMSSVLESDEDFGLVFPDYYLVDDSGHCIGEVRRLDFKKEVSLLDQPAHGACTMIRRDFLLNLGGYDESYSCQDGYELWIKFISHYKVFNINKPLFSYRQHGNNLTTNETKILETRYRIKNNFIDNNKIVTPKTLAVIPVRNTFIAGKNLPLSNFRGEILLEKIVNTALQARKLERVVITSADEEIKDFFDKELSGLSDKLLFVERPVEYARINEPLFKTLHLILDELANDFHPEALMTLAIEYPFMTASMIDDAVNTMTIFGADSLLTVRPDNSIYYRHDGSGLHPILEQQNFTKLEREAVYKAVGGIVLAKLKSFLENNRMLNEKVGHIVVNDLAALDIMTIMNMQRFLETEPVNA